MAGSTGLPTAAWTRSRRRCSSECPLPLAALEKRTGSQPPNPANQSAYGNVRFGGIGRADRMADMGAIPSVKPRGERLLSGIAE
jgi:hypothetical protein